MLKKINISNKSLNRYFIYLLILINLVAGYFLFKFTIANTINTFNTQAEDLISNFSQANKLNSKDFNTIIKNIKRKTAKKGIKNNINDLFK